MLSFRSVSNLCLGGACLCLASVWSAGQGQEAVLKDGERSKGRLEFQSGRLEFLPQGATVPLPWSKIQRVDLPGPDLLPPTQPFWWVLTTAAQDRLAAEVLQLDGAALSCRLPCSDGARIPREQILALERPLGWAPWIRQDLATDKRGWDMANAQAEAERKPAAKGIFVGPPPAKATYTPPGRYPFGLLCLEILNSTSGESALWKVELKFDSKDSPQSLVMILGGEDGIQVSAPGMVLQKQKVQLVPKDKQIEVEIGPRFLQVRLNGQLAAWHEGEHAPCRLVSMVVEHADNAPASDNSAVILQSFALARRMPYLSRPPGQENQDEVWLESGDQVFGSVRTFTAAGVEIAQGNDTRRIPLPEVRGIYFKKPMAASAKPGPGAMRVSFVDPHSFRENVLAGSLQTWSESAVSLKHPYLDVVRIPMKWMRAVAVQDDSSTKP